MAAAFRTRANPSDEEAFIRSLDGTLDPAYRLAFAMLGSRAMAEDAVQEAVLKAWRKSDQLQKGMPLRPWLLGIVANECRSARRGRWSRVMLRERLPETGGMTHDIDAGIDLRRAIATLKPEDRLVLCLRYYLDLGVAETASTIGVSVDAVKSRTHHAINRLRKVLERMEEKTP